MKQSFSLSVKEEIIEAGRSHEEAVLFLLALIRINGTLDSGNIKVRINEDDLRSKVKELIEKELKVETKEEGKLLILKEEDMFDGFTMDISDIELDELEELQTYVTGLFFGKGYVSSPVSKYYHLEIRVKSAYDAINLVEIFQSMGMKAKFQQKGKAYRVYLKKSDDIADLLAAFKSPTFSMLFIDQKIQRDFKATLSRQNAIDVRNQEKIAAASIKHQKACKVALTDLLRYKISKEEERIAKLRIKYPEYSSQDLAYEYNEIYFDNKSKSTINRWLNHIVRIVEEVQDE